MKSSTKLFLFPLFVFFFLNIISVNISMEGFALKQNTLFAQVNNSFWSDSYSKTNDTKSVLPVKYRNLKLNINSFQNTLRSAPFEFTDRSKNSPLIVELPLPEGNFSKFYVSEYSMMEPGLAAQFPEMKTYTIKGIDDPYATGKIDITMFGFHGMVLTPNGDYFIDPIVSDKPDMYISYYKSDYYKNEKFECLVTEVRQSSDIFNIDMTGQQLRTYRLACAADGEYTAFHGGTVAAGQAAIVVAVNRVNGVYERDLSIRMVLIANNTSIVYTNPSTDPYTNNSPSSLINENQTNITNVIGSANYDIGHVFTTGGGGIAGLGVVCNSSQKARGVTGTSSPIGDPFYIDYVAHEMGHQFGGNHTFNSTVSSCGGGNRNASTAWEPGSGSTIMPYAGICGADDLQPNSDDYFHSGSVSEIVAYSQTGTGNTCPVITNTGNTPPTVTVPSGGFTIPISTPFQLTGSATDVETPASLTYCWEEFDVGPAGSPNSPSGNAPIFRSFTPVVSPTRTFPKLSDLLNNTQTLGEILPTYTRSLSFRLTARDNSSGGGGINFNTISFNVNSGSGPFLVTSPNTAVTWSAGSQTVTWNVANTTASPVSCASVNIKLSADGGNTFPTTLASGTANDGSETVTIPNINTGLARIKVESVGNIFFDISNTNFTIGNAPPPALCEDFTNVTFPPTSWNIEFSGTNYWTRNAVSGFGSGSGSSKFDFFNATAGTTQSLVTLTFSASLAGDSIKYDYAYAPYTDGSTDTLEILTSVNGGTNYTSLARYWGNNVNGNLNTAAQIATAYTPSSGQWATRKLLLPTGTNKIKYRARSGFGNNLYLDNICVISNPTAPSISYTNINDSVSLSNRNLNNVVITSAAGINGNVGKRPKIYFKRKRDANSYSGNTNATGGWKYAEAPGSTSPFNFTINYSLLNGSTTEADTIQYFVVAQDLNPAPLVGINSGTFAATPASDSLTSAAFPIGGSINSYRILDNTPPSILYTNIIDSVSLLSRKLNNVIISDASGVNGTSGKRPKIYFKRKRDANAYNGNTNATAGWKYSEASGSSSPFSFTINYFLLNGSTNEADTIQYFVVAQDLASPVNVGINSGTFAAAPASDSLTSAAFPISGSINSYRIIDDVEPFISYSTLADSSGLTFRSLSNVVITDPSGIDGTPGKRPKIYFKRNRDANSYNGNTNATGGWKYTESPGSTSPFSFTINYSLLNGSTLETDTIQYFVVAQDMASPANVGINNGIFSDLPVSDSLTNAAFPIYGSINSYRIIDNIAPLISYSNLSDTASLSNRLFGNVTVTDPSGVQGTSGSRPRIYYKRKSDANTFIDNTNATAGWKYKEANGASSPFSFTFDYSLLNGTITEVDTVQYFVVAQDLYSPANVAINSGNFAAAPTSVNLTSAAFPIGGSINSYRIIDNIAPSISYSNLSDTASLTNRVFSNVTVTDLSGVQGTSGSRPRIYYKRKSDANTFIDNTNATAGWKYKEANSAVSPFSFIFDYSLLNGTITEVDTVQYFVVAQDLYSPANVAINNGNFAAAPASVNLTGAAFPIGGSVNSYRIIDNIGPSITYANLSDTSVFTNRNLINVTITDISGVQGTSGTRPRIYYKRLTEPNVFNDNTNSTAGWKYKEANGSSSPFDFSIDYSLLNGSVTDPDTVQYFVVAQDLYSPANVGINSGSFAAAPSSVNLTSAAFPISGSIRSYKLESLSLTFNLTMLIQGLYNAGSDVMVQDTVTVYLRNNILPFDMMDTSKVFLNNNGTGTFTFYSAVNGVPYFIELKHRNSIGTWSNSAQIFNNGVLTYNFTTSTSQAFGNNMVQVNPSPLRFAVYSGDVNQDGLIELSDITQVFNDANNFTSGYVVTDVTGDEIVDLSDLTLTFNNSSSFVSIATP